MRFVISGLSLTPFEVTDSKAHGGLASSWASDEPARRFVKLDAQTRELANKGESAAKCEGAADCERRWRLADAGAAAGGPCGARLST